MSNPSNASHVSRTASPKKQQDQTVYTVSITDLNNLGCGVGRLPVKSDDSKGAPTDGMVVFVRGAVTGDVVDIKLIKKTSSYAVGRLVRLVSPSPLREAEAFCTAPEACGGCVFRHLTYTAELDSKRQRVKAAFRQAGLEDVTVLPVQSTHQTSGYRNKGMYPVHNGKAGMEAGFYAAKSHTLIPCTACALQPPLFAKVVQAVCAFCDAHHISAYDEISGRGILRHIYLRRTAPAEATPDGRLMLCLVLRTPAFPGGDSVAQDFVRTMTSAFPQIVSIQCNHHPENTNVVLGTQFTVLYGEHALQDQLCGRQFLISPESFYQVNHDAAEWLYTAAARMAGLNGQEHLWDLYCGVGTIGLSMLGHVCGPDGDIPGAADVTGVEIVPQAILCAKQNAALNASLGLIPAHAAHFFTADAGDAATLFAPADRGDVPPPDIVVIDPPRKGTTPALIQEIARRQIPRVVYISCDPETLARDCALFRTCGYAIGEVQPVDMFPRTGHVESVVLMTRKGE